MKILEAKKKELKTNNDKLTKTPGLCSIISKKKKEIA